MDTFQELRCPVAVVSAGRWGKQIDNEPLQSDLPRMASLEGLEKSLSNGMAIRQWDLSWFEMTCHSCSLVFWLVLAISPYHVEPNIPVISLLTRRSRASMLIRQEIYLNGQLRWKSRWGTACESCNLCNKLHVTLTSLLLLNVDHSKRQHCPTATAPRWAREVNGWDQWELGQHRKVRKR